MSGAAPVVSAIIATRNRAALLPASVRSVLAQTAPELEVIVVDDASEDETPSVTECLRGADARVRVRRMPVNVGLAAARNAGLEWARGEFVAFNDDDDLWLPTKLETQLRRFVEMPVAAVVYGPAFYVGTGGARSLIGSECHEGRRAFDRLLRSNFMAAPCPLVRRAIIDRAGRFDERLPALEDWDFWLRLAAVGNFAFAPEPVARVRATAGSMSTDHARMAAAAAMLLQKEGTLPLSDRRQKADFYEALAHELMMHDAAKQGKPLLRAAVRLHAHPRRLVKVLPAEFGCLSYVLGVRAWEAVARSRDFSAAPQGVDIGPDAAPSSAPC